MKRILKKKKVSAKEVSVTLACVCTVNACGCVCTSKEDGTTVPYDSGYKDNYRFMTTYMYQHYPVS